MTKTNTFLLASFLFVGCGDAKTNPTPNPTNSPATTNPPSNKPNPPDANDQFKSGFCEVSIDGAAPIKRPSQLSSKHWKDEVEWPAKVFCDGFDLIGFGDETALPMKPGKYPIYQPGGPKVGVFGIFGNEDYNVTGEVNIESWDDTSIKGSFEAKGSFGVKTTTQHKESIALKGSFESKKGAAPHQPFTKGFCEITANDGLPLRKEGGQSAISTAHWAGPNTKNPSWPLQLNCGKYNLSAEGELKDFPMKPGKYAISTKNTPGSFGVVSPLATPEGELVIDSWDMSAIKGSFEIKGTKMFDPDNTPVTVKGVFDLKCPYTPAGEPCLDKPK